VNTVIALPGLHGSTALFEPLRAHCPDDIVLRTIELPADAAASYDELEQVVAERLPDEPVCLVAESFSGPLAVRLASSHRVEALVLCATFVRSPIPWAARALPWRALFSVRPPLLAISAMLTGGDKSLARALRAEIGKVPAAVLADRARQVGVVDATQQLSRVSCPMLYIRASRDRLVSKRSLEEIRRARPDLRVSEIDAPHLVLQTHPAQCWRAICQFLAEMA
jgi:pimeloyl-ACP methyl ester carboxylesterase